MKNKIGDFEIPEISFPFDAEEELKHYLSVSGSDRGVESVAIMGVQDPELVRVDSKWLRVYAALSYLKANIAGAEANQDELPVTYLAFALNDLGKVDEAVDLLSQLEKRGVKSLWTDMDDENPPYISACMLLDAGRGKEALPYFERALTDRKNKKQDHIWINLVLIHHELGNFEEALKIYKDILSAIEARKPDLTYWEDSLSSKKFKILSHLQEKAK
ncbi:MAG: tetratricopeptide repeat protein [Candidatus Omnitrophica bacterium]|nr:tetratricopeptide repeat protein [Candidatus Omnitrophota bacterium]